MCFEEQKLLDDTQSLPEENILFQIYFKWESVAKIKAPSNILFLTYI